MPVRVIHIKLLFWAAMGFITLSSYSCSEPASPYGQTDITLTALDASCTEVWLELKFSNLTQPADVAIQKDGKDHLRLLSLNHDTLLVLEGLNPSTNYSFRAIIRHEGKDDKISNTAPVRTMDTTSHSFTWQSWSFGTGAGTSRLNDIVVINKNNIWAVGFIKIDGVEYNAIHWNGIEWTLKQIPFTNNGFTTIGEVASISITDDNTVLFCKGIINYYKDSVYVIIDPPDDLFPSRINKLFASSLEDIFIAGDNGLIAHYNGKTWRKIETSAFAQTMRVRDIWSNPESDYVLALATGFPHNFENILIKIDKPSLQTEEIHHTTEQHTLISLWYKNDFNTYLGGSGIFKKNGFTKPIIEIPIIFPSLKRRLRGTEVNNIYACDDFGNLTYFNGIRTRDISYASFIGITLGLDINDNLIGIAGVEDNKSFVSLIKIQE
ncbi:MAG: hypothetical protein IT279_11840 [Ignavibacteriaceae bacterium]|nr:hypothetical protein [Ignavibacteriaceae bacterium]